MAKENEEVLVRDKELDVPYFETPEEAQRKAQTGEVIIVKDEKPKAN